LYFFDMAKTKGKELSKARKEVKRLRTALKEARATNADKKSIKKAKRTLREAKELVKKLKTSTTETDAAQIAVEAGKRPRTRSLSIDAGEAAGKKKKSKKSDKKKDGAFAAFDAHFEKGSSKVTKSAGGGSGFSAADLAWREENNLLVDGKDSKIAAWQNFDDLRKQIRPQVMAVLDKKGWAKPTPIQAQCWPIAMLGRDIVGVAETGSGKTLAFLIPALSTLVCTGRKKGAFPPPRMLVLSPTRELAMQIDDVAQDACRQCGLASVCVYGGVSKRPQLQAIRKGVDIVVATPGRLRDLVENAGLNLGEVEFFTLDEADRMLDLGFMPEIRAIASHLPAREKRQTFMFSATWPNSVRRLAGDFVNNYVKVTVGSDVLTANHRVTQIVEVLEQREKQQRLNAILAKYCGEPRAHAKSGKRVLVFVLYKKEASRVERTLQGRGWSVTGIHGDKSQHDRTEALEAFRSGRKPMLVATDVAARGLDIPDVAYVINNSFPLTIEDYIHRIGRTGRAGKTGTSHTFFTRDDKARAAELTNVLREAKQVIPPDLSKFGLYTKKKTSALYGAHFKDCDMTKKGSRTTFD